MTHPARDVFLFVSDRTHVNWRKDGSACVVHKTLSDFDDFLHGGRLRCSDTFFGSLTLIKGQGQGQGRLKVEKMAFFKIYLVPHFWRKFKMLSVTDTRRDYLNFIGPDF